jgi:hypothetical protein
MKSRHWTTGFVISIVCLVLSGCGGGGESGSSNSISQAVATLVAPLAPPSPSLGLTPVLTPVSTPTTTFSVTPSKLEIKYTQDDTFNQLVTLTAENIGQTSGIVYVVVVDKKAILASVPTVVGIRNGKANINLVFSSVLASGRYQNALSVKLCSDIQCVNEVSGSPLSIPYDVTVEPYLAGSTVCPSVSNSVTVTTTGTLVLGVCDQFESRLAPTRSASAFRSVGSSSPVTYSSVLGYSVSLPLDASTQSFAVPLGSLIGSPGGSNGPSFGHYSGKSYQTIIDAKSGAAVFVYDYRNTMTLFSSKFLDLNFSRFGLFSQFGDLYQGFYGGWSDVSESGAASLNITAVTTFRGIVVGVLAPQKSNTGPETAVGFSADIAIVIDPTKANDQVVSTTLSNFGYSVNGVSVAPKPLASGGVVASGSTLDAVSRKIYATFTTQDGATTKGINTGVINGTMAGPAGAVVSELVGSIQFTTTDGRNAVASFGARSSTSLINP